MIVVVVERWMLLLPVVVLELEGMLPGRIRWRCFPLRADLVHRKQEECNDKGEGYQDETLEGDNLAGRRGGGVGASVFGPRAIDTVGVGWVAVLGSCVSRHSKSKRFGRAHLPRRRNGLRPKSVL